MRKKVLLIFALMLLILLVEGLPAFALDWEDKSAHKTPSGYGNDRKYTRAHWTKFYINYGDETRYVGAKYASVYDYSNLSQGYTAVDEIRDLGRAYGDNSVEVENFLRGLCDAPINEFIHTDKDFRISPAFLEGQYKDIRYGDRWERVPLYFPLSLEESGYVKDVPITRENYGGDLYPADTINNPKCLLTNTPPTDEAAGYDENGRKKKWYSKRSNMYGSISLTKECAKTMYSHPGSMTSAKVTASFPYNVAVLNVHQVHKQGVTAYYDWCVYNQTPLKAKEVYITVWKKTGSQWILIEDHGRVEIPPATTSGWGEYKPATFTRVQASEENYKVVVMANLNPIVFDNNGNATYINCQPLKTEYWSDTLKGAVPPGVGAGGRHEAKPIADFASALGFRVTEGYKDNVNYADAEGETPVPIPPGPEPPAGESNLSIYDMHVYDKETGQDVTNPTFNQTLGIKASYKSTFDVGGWARLRFYRYYEGYNNSLTQIGDNVNYYFEPGADVTYDYGQDYGFRIVPGQYEIIASIDYYNNGNDPDDNWQPEKFDGKYDETTYDDNKMARDLTGSDVPYVPPTPTERSESVWYPPLAWVEVPGEIHTHTEKEDIYGWKEIPLTKDMPEAKKKVRLVPNIKE